MKQRRTRLRTRLSEDTGKAWKKLLSRLLFPGDHCTCDKESSPLFYFEKQEFGYRLPEEKLKKVNDSEIQDVITNFFDDTVDLKSAAETDGGNRPILK